MGGAIEAPDLEISLPRSRLERAATPSTLHLRKGTWGCQRWHTAYRLGKSRPLTRLVATHSASQVPGCLEATAFTKRPRSWWRL